MGSAFSYFMDLSIYQPPVSELLTYGSCLELDKKRVSNPHNERIAKEMLLAGPGSASRELAKQLRPTYAFDRWPKYIELLGITSAHIPALIKMATADTFDLEAESLAVWAPVHAWRCLGFLKADAAVDPLLSLLQDEEADWILEEIPWVLGMIGEKAIAPTALYLASQRHNDWFRTAAISALEYIAVLHPALKETCIKKIGSQLANFQNNSPELNGFLVSSLIELAAINKANLIERAYASGNVDDSICGNWPSVQIDMGLAKVEDFHPSELEPEYAWVRDEPPARSPRKPTGLDLPTKQVKKKTSQAVGFGSSKSKSPKKKR